MPKTFEHVYRNEEIINDKCSDIVHPTIVELFHKMKVVKVSCGEGHCLAVNTK